MIHCYGFSALIFLNNFTYDCELDYCYKVSIKLVSLFSSYKLEYRLEKEYDELSKESIQIHYGILPKFKKMLCYKRLFFEKVPGFIGISTNIFQDSNINDRQNKVIMLSIGSWNHKYRTYLPIQQGIHKKYLFLLKKNLIDYRINTDGMVILFVQNYSPNEYWFGWTTNDIEHWIERELRCIEEIKTFSDKNILVKFHPKTQNTYVEYMKKRIIDKYISIQFVDSEINLDTLLLNEKVYACVINSGTVVIEACLRGVPCFYVDDYYSNIPLHKFCTPINKLNDFTRSDLTNQDMFLDFICSQCCILDENISEIINLMKKEINVKVGERKNDECEQF